MSQPVNKILKALFDIKPVDDTGRVDVEKIHSVQPVVDLANQKPAEKAGLGNNSAEFPLSRHTDVSRPSRTIAYERMGSTRTRVYTKPRSVASRLKPGQDSSAILSQANNNNFFIKNQKTTKNVAFGDSTEEQGYPGVVARSLSIDELEKYLNSDLNIRRELKDIGGKAIVKKEIGKPRYKNSIKYKVLSIKYKEENTKNQESEILNTKYIIHNTKPELEYEAALAQINQKASPAYEPVLTGEPRRIYPFERPAADVDRSRPDVDGALSRRDNGTDLTKGNIGTGTLGTGAAEIESWARYATSKARNFQSRRLGSRSGASPTLGELCRLPDRFASGFPTFNFQSIFKSRISKLKEIYKLCLSLACRSFGSLKISRRNLLAVGVMGFSALVFTSFGQYGISVKNEVMKESNLAVASLEQANESLRVFDFEAASSNFAQAYEEFAKAGDNLNFMGASITSLFAELPGAGKLKSAKNLVEAGKLLAEAGKSMSEAVNSLSQTSAVLDYNGLTITNGQTIIGGLKGLLLASSKNLSKASALLSEVSLDALPEDKRESFSEFQSKLPEFEKIVSDAVEYTDFLERFLGPVPAAQREGPPSGDLLQGDNFGSGAVKYLILFQNNSELRPTGGFPGTYAVVTFKDGRLAEFVVDDVYNLDGQLKENIIPPKPLQHITPNWGMRDANWFIDFSVSAQKVMEFFKKEASYEVDGVITMSPRMISDILKVVGPIEMPEYGYEVNDENFLPTVQAEIEYGDNREQPKSIVMDMAPKLLEKIYSSEPGQWLDIFNVFVSGLDKKDILMYFKDLNLERFAAEKGFGGLIKDTRTHADSTRTDTDMDYLMVTFTNIKGSKTDRVTDNSISINSKFETLNSKPVIIHKLTITRQHNGGDTRYGFYNRQNPAYVRVLVPEGSELLSISGNSDPGFKPLIGYSGTDFKQDKDLFEFESGFDFDSEKGASTYKESGKTGFAFWLITDPGERKTVELEYAVPINDTSCPLDTPCPRTIYIQKQPGLEVGNFEFQVGEDYIYNGKFDKDLEFKINH